MPTINSLIKSPRTQVFRKCYIKRRNIVTGLFESDWYEITQYIKKWGRISTQLDSTRPYKFTFGNLKLVTDNTKGKFNPSDNNSSLWFNYLNQQRTLIKIEAGYLERQENPNGYWKNLLYPNEGEWNVGQWNVAEWNGIGAAAQFQGIISGDILLDDNNEVTFNVKPLVSVFQDYAARNLTGFTSTGMTASQFMQLVRDQTDGSGSYIFQPFFGDTTSNWDISTTTNVYSSLNTSTADGIFDATVWEVIEKLAEAENFVPYVTKNGVFKFVSRDVNTTTSAFDFYGNGYFNTEYGHTIKSISDFGFKISKFYSRVEVKYKKEDTATSYEVYQSDFEVSGDNNPWVFGQRTLKIDNTFIATSTVANTIALNIFNDVAGFKKEVRLTTSFIPTLDILDRFRIFYDPSEVRTESLWDQQSWADDSTSTSQDLIWDSFEGQSILLQGENFKFVSLEMDLDNFENIFVARGV